jgi:hypothetical protein
MFMKIESRYLNNEYLNNNPNWDREDAEWKAHRVAHILNSHQVKFSTICEVGCGSGDVLRYLFSMFPFANLKGFDISPQLIPFWQNAVSHISPEGGGVSFELGNFHEINTVKHDVLLMLDVFEHVRDPFTFLEEARKHAKNFVFHIPLDLSAFGVARKNPLLKVRRSVGHLNYYTKDIALETLKDCGFQIIEWKYTGASLNSPSRSFITRLAAIPRRILYAINKDAGVRILGGETLLVLAK